MKQIVFVSSLLVLGAILGFLYPFSVTSSGNQVVEMHGNWVSAAVSIAELAQEADVIVRVRVTQAGVNRVVEQTLPVYTSAGEGELVQPVTSDEELSSSDKTMVMSTPFTDFEVEVVEIFKGKAEATLTIMQNGGELNGQRYAMVGEPLLQVNGEYVLFLVDMSGDEVHAPGRALYRVVNPAGQYLVQGEQVSTAAENETEAVLPTTLTELQAEIKEALANQ
jgi:hypothetical protein